MRREHDADASATDVKNVFFRAPTVWAILGVAVWLGWASSQTETRLSTQIATSQSELKSDIRDISTRMDLAAEADLKLRDSEARARVAESESAKQRVDGLTREVDELRRALAMLKITVETAGK